MSRTYVESSSIKAIGYDASRRMLEVEFVTGAVHGYFGVPPRVFDELLCARSVVAAFEELVRGRYDWGLV